MTSFNHDPNLTSPDLTMETIYRAVLAAKGRASRDIELLAETLGVDPNELEKMVRSMAVSGYLLYRNDVLSIGPTPMSAGDGSGHIRTRRPLADVTTVVQDRLRIAKRIRLWEDETPTGSDFVRVPQGNLVCAVGVTQAGQPTVRVGVGIFPEDKHVWSGANGGSTVVLDSDGVDQLERAVEQVIAEAEAAEGPYREADRRVDLARDALAAAEKKRIGADAGCRKADAEHSQRAQERWQKSRYRAGGMKRHVNTLDPDARAEYDALEEQYQAFVRPTGSPAHIDACREERRRIRAQQMTLFTPLSPAEALEVLTLIEVPYLQRSAAAHRREKELWEKAGVDSYATSDHWARYMTTHLAGDKRIDEFQKEIEQIEANANPVSAEQMAVIEAARREERAAQEAYDALAGNTICRVEVPGRWGTVVVESVQGEEGNRHCYRVDVRPPSHDDDPDWYPGSTGGEPWDPKAEQLRQMAAMVRAQHDAAAPPGWRRKPAGVPPV